MKAKKIISLLLALALVVSLFAACGGDGKGSSSQAENSSDESNQTESTGGESSEGEAESTGKVDGGGYEVNYMYLVAQEGTNQNKVNEAVAALAEKELNMKVNMIPMTFGTLNSQLSMMLAAGEPLDIFPAFSSNFSTYIESQYVVNLAPYLDDLQGAKEVLGSDFDCGYLGDFFIGLGQMKERGYPAGLVVRKDIFEELGYKVEDFNITTDDYSSFDQIGDMFAKVKEKHPDMICLDGTSIMGTQDLSYMDNMGSNFGVLENYGQTTEITNWFEGEQWRTFCEIAQEWFKAGYLSQDIAVNQDGGETKLKAGNCFSFITNVKPNTDIEKLAQTGYEVSVIQMGEAMKNTNAVNSMLFAVANAAEDPQKAAQFLNWTYTSQEFNDLINWGIEGEDWVLTDDGLASYPDGVDATSVGYHNDFGFVYPNQFAGHPWAGNPTDIWEQYDVYNEGITTSKAYGFTFDSTPVANEEAQLNSVVEQYRKDLAFGVVDDLDAKIKEFNDALYAAGLQTVMDEKQEQFNEWLEKQ